MAGRVASGRGYGGWLLVASAVAGLVAAGVAAFNEGNGIAYSGGAILVLVSTALLVVAALILGLFHGKPRWLTGLFAVLALLDILGTGLAAYFLDAYVLLALMGLCLIAWLVYLVADPADGRRDVPAATGRAVWS